VVENIYHARGSRFSKFHKLLSITILPSGIILRCFVWCPGPKVARQVITTVRAPRSSSPSTGCWHESRWVFHPDDFLRVQLRVSSSRSPLCFLHLTLQQSQGDSFGCSNPHPGQSSAKPCRAQTSLQLNTTLCFSLVQEAI
jgi:hypothetical protein